MLPDQQLEADLRASLTELTRRPLAEILLQHGILRRLATDHLLARLRETVCFSAEEEQLVISRLWQGVALEPPPHLEPGWLEALDPMLQGPLRERWDQIRLQKWMEEAYRERVEPYFLERRDDLEQVVYGMIRLRNQGTAEELYLRLLDDKADFGELARVHSLGEERFTRGLVGPMAISQPHPTIRAVLQSLAVDDLHPPFRVDNWILLVRMEHRQPARLNDATLLQLSQELLQKDVDAVLDARLAELYPALLEAFPAAAATGMPAAQDDQPQPGPAAEATQTASPAPQQQPPIATAAPPEGPEAARLQQAQTPAEAFTAGDGKPQPTAEARNPAAAPVRAQQPGSPSPLEQPPATSPADSGQSPTSQTPSQASARPHPTAQPTTTDPEPQAPLQTAPSPREPEATGLQQASAAASTPRESQPQPTTGASPVNPPREQNPPAPEQPSATDAPAAARTAPAIPAAIAAASPPQQAEPQPPSPPMRTTGPASGESSIASPSPPSTPPPATSAVASAGNAPATGNAPAASTTRPDAHGQAPAGS